MRFLLRRTRTSRHLDVLVFAIIVLAILFVLWLLPEPEPIEVSGSATVIDGDSLAVGGHEIRLLGVDAPEREQTCTRKNAEWRCGAEAAGALRNRMRGQTIKCSGNERDIHDRLLAVCRVRGTELNRWLVEQGWAVSYGHYYDEEQAAKRARRGIWSGSFTRPRDWRDEVR